MKNMWQKIKNWFIDLTFPYRNWKYGAKGTTKDLEKLSIKLPEPYHMSVDKDGLGVRKGINKSRRISYTVARVVDSSEFENLVKALRDDK